MYGYNYTSLRLRNFLYTYDKRVKKEMEPTHQPNISCLLLEQKPIYPYQFRILYYICLRSLVVKICGDIAHSRLGQIRDWQGVTRATFIENSNNVQFFIKFI